MYAALARQGLTIPAGSCPSVGIGGHVVGGGVGLAGRAFSLAADNIVSAELVTADGATRRAQGHSDPELLWALRGGGGGNFGVLISLTLRVHRPPRTAAWFFVSWPWHAADEALATWLDWAPHARDELTSIFHLETGATAPVVSVAGQYLGPARDLNRLLAPLRTVAGASVSTGEEDYLGLQVRWAGCLGQPLSSCHTAGTRPGGALARAGFRAKSDYLTRALAAAGRQALIAAVERRQGQAGSGAILFDAYGGAINRVPASATAFVHRGSLCCLQYLDYGGSGQWLQRTWRTMRPYVSGMAYQNYIDPELTDWRTAYYGSNYPRLLAVLRRVNPDHFFKFPQAIGA